MIYEPVNAKGYECVNACDERDYEIFRSFTGDSIMAIWRPIKVRRVRADHRQEFRSSDFPWLGSDVLVMRQRTIDMLGDMLHDNGELLPLEDEDGVSLYAFNAQVVAALDEGNSTIMRFPESNRIMYIRKVAFIQNVIEGLDVFRLPIRASSTYVSERFVERYKAAGLVGLDFEVCGEDRIHQAFGKK